MNLISVKVSKSFFSIYEILSLIKLTIINDVFIGVIIN